MRARVRVVGVAVAIAVGVIAACVRQPDEIVQVDPPSEPAPASTFAPLVSATARLPALSPLASATTPPPPSAKQPAKPPAERADAGASGR